MLRFPKISCCFIFMMLLVCFKLILSNLCCMKVAWRGVEWSGALCSSIYIKYWQSNKISGFSVQLFLFCLQINRQTDTHNKVVKIVGNIIFMIFWINITLRTININYTCMNKNNIKCEGIIHNNSNKICVNIFDKFFNIYIFFLLR